MTARNSARAHQDGKDAPAVLAATNDQATDIVPLAALPSYAVDVPADPSSLTP